MPGFNATGTPNTKDYNLGRGTVYFAAFPTGSATGRSDAGYRDLGNCPEFNISVDVETLEHQSSQEGLKVTDKEFVISQKVNLSLSLDEINFENGALFFSGTAGDGTYLNTPAISGIEAAAATGISLVSTANFTAGRWYDIADASGNRAYDILAANLRLNAVATAGTDYVQVTDYTVDEKMGRVFIPSVGAIATANAEVFMELAPDGGAVAADEISALAVSSVSGSLKFISENPTASDHQTEYEFHQVSLKADGDFSLIGDEFTTMQLTGVAERNTLFTALGASKTLTIRTHANAGV